LQQGKRYGDGDARPYDPAGSRIVYDTAADNSRIAAGNRSMMS